MEALSGVDAVKSCEDGFGQRGGRNFSSEPGAGAVPQQVGYSAGCWSCNEGKTGGCGFKQHIGQAFQSRREDKEIDLGEERVGPFHIAHKSNCGAQSEAHGLEFKTGAPRPFAHDEQVGVRIALADLRQSVDEEIEALLGGEAADGEQMGAGSGPVGGCFSSGADSVEINGVGEDGNSLWIEMGSGGKVLRHGLRLADDEVDKRVKGSIKRACVTREPRGGQVRRGSCILADHDAGPVRKEGAQEKHKKVQVRHAGENYLRAELPDKAQQG